MEEMLDKGASIHLYLVVECILRMLISKKIANRDYSNNVTQPNVAGIGKEIGDLWLIIRKKKGKKSTPDYVNSGLSILDAIEQEKKDGELVSLFKEFTENVLAKGKSLEDSLVYKKLTDDLGDEFTNPELLHARKAQLKLGIVDLLAANEAMFGLNKLRGEAERVGFIEKDGGLSTTLKNIASFRHEKGHSLWTSADTLKMQEYMKNVKSATDKLIPMLEGIINPSDVSFYFKQTILRNILLTLFIYYLLLHPFCFFLVSLCGHICCCTTLYLFTFPQAQDLLNRILEIYQNFQQ